MDTVIVENQRKMENGFRQVVRNLFPMASSIRFQGYLAIKVSDNHPLSLCFNDEEDLKDCLENMEVSNNNEASQTVNLFHNFSPPSSFHSISSPVNQFNPVQYTQKAKSNKRKSSRPIRLDQIHDNMDSRISFDACGALDLTFSATPVSLENSIMSQHTTPSPILPNLSTTYENKNSCTNGPPFWPFFDWLTLQRASFSQSPLFPSAVKLELPWEHILNENLRKLSSPINDSFYDFNLANNEPLNLSEHCTTPVTNSTLKSTGVKRKRARKVMEPGDKLKVSKTRKSMSIPRVFTCNQCKEQFSTLTALSAHTTDIHAMYRCTICRSEFTQRSNLQRHSLKHVGFKPFQCRLCDKAYYRKDHLMRHLDMSHPGHDAQSSIEVMLTYSECLDYLESLPGRPMKAVVAPNSDVSMVQEDQFQSNTEEVHLQLTTSPEIDCEANKTQIFCDNSHTNHENCQCPLTISDSFDYARLADSDDVRLADSNDTRLAESDNIRNEDDFIFDDSTMKLLTSCTVNKENLENDEIISVD